MRFMGLMLLYLCMTATAADQVYRWVDSEGHVHFSQTPPPGAGTKVQAVDIQTRPADPAAVQAAQDLAQQQARAADQKADAAERQAEQDAKKKAVMQQYCDNLKAKLQLFEQSASIFTMDTQGNRHYESDEEHEKKIRDMQAEINKNCSG